MNSRFDPSGPLRGKLRAPADKSISHRAALLGAMSSRPLRIEPYLKAADTKSTLAAARALGSLVEMFPAGVVVLGNGPRAARQPRQPIDVGNAGTLLRLLPGWLAGQEGRSFTLDGDESIRRRPIDRVAAPLAAMGARLTAREDRYAPLRIEGTRLHGIEYRLPVASAQVKSCLLFAGLLAEGPTTVIEPIATRDHSERLLAAAGVKLQRQGEALRVWPVEELSLEQVAVPGDLSSAAFLIAGALLVPGSNLRIEGVGVNWTRTGFLRIAERMGAGIAGELEQEQGEHIPDAEPISDLDVTHAPLVGTTVEASEVPLAIDELPLVALLGCFADGETIVRGAGELRMKESDRIETVVSGLRALGGDIEATDEGFAVRGGGGLRGGVIDAHGDHRLAMLGAIAGLASREGVEVRGVQAAAISYPRFERDLRELLGG